MTRVNSKATDAREIAIRALALLDHKDALIQVSRVAMGPRPGPELDAVLAELGDSPPMIPVRCQRVERCGGKRICKWVYDPQWKSVVPVQRQTEAWTRGAPFWLDRANAHKGTVETADGPAA